MAKCSVCSKEVISMHQAMTNPARMAEMIAKTGLRCSGCGTVSCQSCAHDRAKSKGNNFFTCPSCDANVNDCQLR